ncbi:MAG: hypothetical protein RL594_1144 [Bacteroidota bacterium]|jgi:hypothetical protein
MNEDAEQRTTTDMQSDGGVAGCATTNPLRNDVLHVVVRDKQEYFKIGNVDAMPVFFMSIVSDSNHWMFLASNGGLTAGRVNADNALFPYCTQDKVIDSSEYAGSKTIVQGYRNGELFNWEPFSIRSNRFNIERNLYKHRLGNSVIFEEYNHDLNLCFSYEWSTSDRYGFVKASVLANHSNDTQELRILDGLQNVMPAGVESDLQNTFSNLVDAYKHSELHAGTRLGIFALSARITDRAEPSEALFANTVWSSGMEEPVVLLSSKQIERFRDGLAITTENDNKGGRGAYLISSKATLSQGGRSTWKFVANVKQSQSQVIALIDEISAGQDIVNELVVDVQRGAEALVHRMMSVDGIHLTGDPLIDSRHFSNSLFNAMRGGLFPKNYTIEKQDFIEYVRSCNSPLYHDIHDALSQLRDEFTLRELQEEITAIGNQSLSRIALEYLPLTFSRRHGDPSRPWNRFTINTKNSDGSLRYDYQGNWRDIFQNWEALAHSYPLFLEGMVRKFLNATTIDGYNPYRVQKNGFDWEVIEPHNPWSYIGYWGDHQIIYLLKLLELLRDTQPDVLHNLVSTEGFAFACVPYRLKSYEDIIRNPKDTVIFDHALHAAVTTELARIGSDGALVKGSAGGIHHGHFIEKILITLLARLTNYVPDGGIWMNTQRPEWNDANNALVGNGLSMVTLCYLHRFITFFNEILDTHNNTTFRISEEIAEYLTATSAVFIRYPHELSDFSDEMRRSMMDELGLIGSAYRAAVYSASFSGSTTTVSQETLKNFCENVLMHLRFSISKNKRTDGLYHAYNLITLAPGRASITRLPVMLEGQVAVLSSGCISPSNAIALLTSLSSSDLFREDQHSYMLYPVKEVASFLDKNIIPKEKVEDSRLLSRLIADGNDDIIQRDVHGSFHFNGNLTNIREFRAALRTLDSPYHDMLTLEEEHLIDLYESVFQHKQYTGRSGSFFAYEGIGSIYWHMVSKLRYAVQETYCSALKEHGNSNVTNAVLEFYKSICDGIGVRKSPQDYGAFPTDPYSHTPLSSGAQQPGMTGQVKEDVICRMRELGVFYERGTVHLVPNMLSQRDFLRDMHTIEFQSIRGDQQSIALEKGMLFFSVCQTPIRYELAEKNEVTIYWNTGNVQSSGSLVLPPLVSKSIIERTGEIRLIHVSLDRSSICA